jgi:hypothetical protein
MNHLYLIAFLTCVGCAQRYVVVPASNPAGDECARQCVAQYDCQKYGPGTMDSALRRHGCDTKVAECFQGCPGSIVFESNDSSGNSCVENEPVPGFCARLSGN